MEAFGRAILDSQRDNDDDHDNANKNLNASLFASGEIFYNRVGQNWRWVGKAEDLVLQQAPFSQDDAIAGIDRLDFHKQQMQILAYNDSK